MDKLVITGGNPLFGSIEINGAKNAAVAILPAAIMASKNKCVIDNIPNIEDVHCIERILKSLGCDIKTKKNSATIDSTHIASLSANTDDVRKMRASYYLIGALLGRFKKASVELPGGCPIGVRPIDQHIKGFEALGAKVKITHGSVMVEADELIGTNIFFDVVSVGATINVMLAATLAKGVTTLENVAKEPHVVDVANFLNSMGANIKGAGTDVIRIVGVESLSGCTYSVIPDQIEAGTYMIASAACGGEVTIENVIPKHLESISAKLVEMGSEIRENGDSITVKSSGNLKGVNIKTQPYPGFPTDVQQPMSTLLTVAKGRSIINESIWESRFKHVDELKKMGANIKVEGRTAIIDGVDKLTGAVVKATDLRAGAAMVIAGLIAEGTTEVLSIEHIDRGYPNIEDKFKALGAYIHRECE
ncbi:UDP-N-acetylglucosamine 1-carboxyvinyltransferase [Clostridium tyrobutyricum]|jgi:UDP-N-acetylglucosamine 1-carboxyvinyltransferase|uniref:UDP-N-acetylglucosamine 1-carboxyvinyltransferase n=1 Tax=Clostridium tyrobutyricum DIVETGP TaxID=1408889 RepID=W6N5V7_CLOTY|nr:UDP-N-acetylglucosamine 1-carboxyvinyltransferase [Clostridium tyrobutyricum]AND86215.1 UDP-N-acetylglucosamine 1-carboxyvinyltransferase [Clostridium tyrobutyricum]ANP70706.1 UDP-N-acetylglucosamine 1-carboxyvinyltransferase [Clostridium tyrobutyricum]MBV4426286.1 UDP-N-acetylglucosamine 1-carboxyvinyltransferase [Clostridium tyrobutyricum]MBV4429294.1 UDP-N-acetylglucosamine 1-carboxyvinyltransferase [Clostridium tyrobutyricum]MBV4435560.1 UDP-N-acetylglucosamine 1-carboxyvinyltransferase